MSGNPVFDRWRAEMDKQEAASTTVKIPSKLTKEDIKKNVGFSFGPMLTKEQFEAYRASKKKG